MKKIIVAAIIILFICPCAYSKDLHIDIQAKGFTRLNVAMPPFAGRSGSALDLWKICSKDLEMSGVFTLLAPKGYLSPGPIAHVKEGTLKDWMLIGADYVITGMVTDKDKRVELGIEVIKVATSRVILKKTYAIAAKNRVRLAHSFMDDFMDKSLGLSPVFSSRIVCCQKKQGKKQLFMSWCDGTAGKTISGLGNLVLNPAWAPGAGHIAFVSYWRDNPDLYMLDLASFRVRLVSSSPGINTTPAFTPSGDKIAATLFKYGNPDIFLVDIKTRKATRLTKSWGTDTSPSFSPDAKTMVFCSSRGGNPQIYIRDIATRRIQRLTFEGKYNTAPAFSPRGDLIAFTHSAKDKRFHIAVIRPDGSHMRVLPGTLNGDESPSFSPDGRLIAFASSDGNIYVCDLAGSDPVRVIGGQGVYTEPSWSGVVER
ncbi:MAG: hypothetical protein U9P80_02430 [Thermodesulfobacteriota bacterium]|nr:hypothetical protein [Thermodesulfobacteriota bacterium]